MAIAKGIRRLSIPIVIAWMLMVACSSLIKPLEQVERERAVSLTPATAPSMQSMVRAGKLFGESDSNSIAMVVLEADHPLDADDHRFYDDIVGRLRADRAHVEHVADFWGDPLTEAAAQSTDGKAAYAQLSLAGNIGENTANASVDTVRQLIGTMPAPRGVTVFVTGPTALQADLNIAGDRSLMKVTLITFGVIVAMLLFFYRSIFTVILVFLLVGIQLGAARGVIALLGDHGLIGLSTFAVNLLVVLAIAAGTDYAIFLVGRYQEARSRGLDQRDAYDEMFTGTAHVILGSGLTIAGAMFCLSFTRMPYFQTLGVPCAVGLLAAVAVALTLGPSIIWLGSRFGLFEPKRPLRIRAWRRLGTVVARWPKPVLAGSLALALIGLAALPGYRTNYDDRQYIPADIPANLGFQAADRHFAKARLYPEMLLIEADHDLRNPADFLVLDKIAKAVFHVPGVARVQSITRPQGTPLAHTSLPFLIGMQSAGQSQNMKFMKDRTADLKKQADLMDQTVQRMQSTYSLMTQMSEVTHRVVSSTGELQNEIHALRDQIGDIDDFLRPVRNYVYWEPHCFDVPACVPLRSMFDALDGVDTMSDTLGGTVADMHTIDRLMPAMLAQVGPMIESMRQMRQMLLASYSTMSGIYDELDEVSKDAIAMGHDFDAAKNDDSFYLPVEAFDNPAFRASLRAFISPDGKAARMLISHRGEPASVEGISHVEPITNAAIEAVKGTPLEQATISLGGMAGVFKDMSEGSAYDLLIAAVASLALIFGIMLILTRALIAALVIVGTVAISLGASFGMSIILWQYIFGIDLHWLVMQMTVIVLLAVGADYNLMLVARLKEELVAGYNTALIRATGGTGSVVTAAGIVFAATMSAMVISDLRIIGQIGTCIGLGLLFDTLIVRTFMTPALAAMFGKWFWWPAVRLIAMPTVDSTPDACKPQETPSDAVHQ